MAVFFLVAIEFFYTLYTIKSNSMKKLDLCKLLALGFSFVAIQGIAQDMKKAHTTENLKTNKAVTRTVHSNSPVLVYDHDHEKCLTEHITQAWVESAGIEAEYQSQVTYQNNLASLGGGGDRSIYTIPVIFHVIYNTPAENVSETAILELLAAVNEDFSATNPDAVEARAAFGFIPDNAEIEFCLAAQDEAGTPLVEYGIHRVATSEVWFNPSTETNKMKGSTGGDTGTEGWDRNRYLNVWICDITNGAGSGVAGYAYKPTIAALPPADIDGIVIDYNLGMNPDAHILSHEIGHFFGLDHTWGSGGGSCGTDDGLGDTPNTAGPSFDFAGSCSGSQTTCPGTQTQYENFMDYSNCTVMFTANQVNLMHLVLGGSRAALATSDACESPFPMPPVADFEADITTLIATGSANFTDLSTNYPTAWLWSVSPAVGVSFIGGTSSSSENPIIQFNIAGLYSITLTASNGEGSDGETKTNYINVLAGGDGTTDCDTIRNYTPAEYAGASVYTIADEAGFYPAQLTLFGGDLVQAYAESFNAPSPTFVKGIRVPIYQADDIAGASNVTFRVWNDVAGAPGTILGSKVVPINDLDAGFFNVINFDSGIPVSGNYWVGVQFSYSFGFDTVMFATTDFSDRPAGPSTTSMNITGIGWVLTSDVFVGEPNCSLILDVLTSNGPSPVSVVSFPTTETCDGMEVTMNGFGSLNTTDYYWDISDGTDDYFYDEANLTTTFDVGTWTISLIASGSCESDESAVYTLVVNPALNVAPGVVDESCDEADGAINFVVTGGDGGPYDYSINGGATFSPSPSFTGLSTGSYDYVITDDANCEATGTILVDNINPFSPTITPDQVISLGESVDLTVTGGVSWEWYDGVTLIGVAPTISVSPTVTTAYLCYAADGDGCARELDVTVFIDDGSGIEGVDLEKSLSIFPNPTNGQFSILFNLIEAQMVTVEIRNVIGEVVVLESAQSIQQNQLDFDLSDMAQGIYFVVIRTENQAITKKISVGK